MLLDFVVAPFLRTFYVMHIYTFLHIHYTEGLLTVLAVQSESDEGNIYAKHHSEGTSPEI